MKNGLKRTTPFCIVLFFILLVVHAWEAIFIRMDETVLGENFINKVFGLIVMAICLKLMELKWEDIGFRGRVLKLLGLGLLLAIGTFTISYATEFMILAGRKQTARLEVFTTGFSLNGQNTMHTGMVYILVCIFFNIINVLMEEGVFRGLFPAILKRDHSDRIALLLPSFLFGIWHIVTPLHNLVDGDIGLPAFLLLSVGYTILAGMMGIKWCLLYRLTGSLYAGMADHFFNNCIATNLLHVVTDTGVDEMMILRVFIAQMISFFVVYTIYRRKGTP